MHILSNNVIKVFNYPCFLPRSAIVRCQEILQRREQNDDTIDYSLDAKEYHNFYSISH